MIDNTRTEQRQHLNISNHAYEILLSDIDAFAERGGMSGIINRILTNYMEDSEASISSAAEKKRQQYYALLRNEKKDFVSNSSDEKLTDLTPAEKRTVDMICSSYAKELTDHFLYGLPPKEKTLKIRLQNDIYDILGPSVPLADDCYRSAGNYIRAILEDYSSQSVYRREEIYFKDMYQRIRSALLIHVEQRSLMTIRIKGKSGSTQDFRIKPYGLSDEAVSPYHYLIALSRPVSDQDHSYAPAVFRMSRILKLYDTPSYGSGKITAKEKKTLEDAIKQRSIPYLLDDTDDYAIELTPNGISMYKSILHLRPIADDSKTKALKSGNIVMLFHCTYRQIENYFFKFGKEAKILAPKEAADKFKTAYKAALGNYK